MSEDDETKHVVIIGAGFGGIACGLALMDKLGWKNFTIFEKAEQVGGTWRENTYPGCACDVPSHWYSLSTSPNPNWSQTYSSQPEILSYIRQTVESRGLLPHIQFSTRVIDCAWDASSQEYDIVVERLAGGESTIEYLTASVVISAVGGLHVPNIPSSISSVGLDKFKGSWWHAAQWRHDIHLAGKNVGIVGTGCSAVQIVPEISKDETLNVVQFCRTPSWFVPRRNKTIAPWLKWVFAHIPFVMLLHRFWLYFLADLSYPVWEKPWLRKFVAKKSEEYIRAKAPKELAEKLVPKYGWGCKRVIRDPGYLESLHQPNVLTEWDGIGEVVEDGIITKTGTKHQLDVLVLATGFDLAPCAPITGTKSTLKDYFKQQGGQTAYRGITVPTFPNLFLVLGPNVASGHGSALFTEEAQADYIAKMVKPILLPESTSKPILSLTVKEEACNKYNEDLQQSLGKTVWNSCVSYYNQNEVGKKNVAVFPGSLTKYWRSIRTPEWNEFETVPVSTSSNGTATGNGKSAT